ncbi:hypothetical protein SAVIM338S_07174 [Streptomyces avidinii]
MDPAEVAALFTDESTYQRIWGTDSRGVTCGAVVDGTCSFTTPPFWLADNPSSGTLTHGWTVNLEGQACLPPVVKNGRLPGGMPRLSAVNSVGIVERAGHTLLVVVLTDGQPTRETGIALIERAAATAVDALLDTPAGSPLEGAAGSGARAGRASRGSAQSQTTRAAEIGRTEVVYVLSGPELTLQRYAENSPVAFEA